MQAHEGTNFSVSRILGFLGNGGGVTVGKGMMMMCAMGRRHFLGVAAGAVLAGRIGVAEAPDTDETGEAFSFAVIADPHCAEGPKTAYVGCGSGVDKLVRCFEAMNGLPENERPDFALIAGDIHPAALAPHMDRVSLPVHVVAGNHEGSAETRGQLRALFPGDFGSGDNVRDYYAFTHKGVLFLGICDAGAGGDHIGHFSSELIEPEGQCEWLEKELGAPGTRKVLFAHIPPVLDGGERNMYMGRNDSRWFVDLVTRTSPEMLFFGHLHRDTEEYPIGKSRAVNVRSCCWNFQDGPIGFLLVRVDANGMTWREMMTGDCSAPE